MPFIKRWVGTETKFNVREEALYLSALARLDNLVLLDDSYNLQMHFYLDEIISNTTIKDSKAYFKDNHISVFHFTGMSKPYYHSHVLNLLREI
jgi:hypothetical protein